MSPPAGCLTAVSPASLRPQRLQQRQQLVHYSCCGLLWLASPALRWAPHCLPHAWSHALQLSEGLSQVSTCNTPRDMQSISSAHAAREQHIPAMRPSAAASRL
jgi:hypothetical protein